MTAPTSTTKSSIRLWYAEEPDISALEDRTLQLSREEAVDLTVHWTVRPEVRDMDLDLSALLLNREGKVARRYDMVFCNQNSDQSGAVLHLGDDVLSEGRGQETLRLELDRASEQLSEIVINLSCAFRLRGGRPGLEALEAVWLNVSDIQGEECCFSLDTAELSGPAASILSEAGGERPHTFTVAVMSLWPSHAWTSLAPQPPFHQ